MEKGGRTDKLGNRYEGTWIALQLMYVLAGESKSVEIESVGDDEKGVDLWVIGREGRGEAQQVKRGNRSEGRWTLPDLASRRIISHIKAQLERGKSNHFAFVSGDTTPTLRELCERAAGAGGDAERFYSAQALPNKPTRESYKQLCGYLKLSADEPDDRSTVFDLLLRTRVEQFPPGHDGEAQVRTLARGFVEGDPRAVLSVLRDSVSDKGAWARPLDVAWVSSVLEGAGFKLRNLSQDATLVTRIESLQREFKESLVPQLIGDELRTRKPAQDLATLLKEEKGPRVIAVLGEAGSGKSCVLLELAASLLDAGTPFLPIRLDTRRPKTSSTSFGKDVCGLPESPGLCLHAMAGQAESVLILDQLDAIRWTAGHGFAEWEACKESIRDALLFPNVRVVVACRSFDWKTDPQIDAWKKEAACRELPVPGLTEQEVGEVLKGMGFGYADLSDSQKRMLQSPLALSLWSKLKSAGADPTSLRSTSELVAEYWRDRLARIDAAGGEAAATVAAVDSLVDYMDREERLDAPRSKLEDDPKTLELLVSNGILGISGKRLRFVHQGLLDYRLARRVLDSISASGHQIGEWVAAGEQPLFRREQLRLALDLFRQETPASLPGSIHGLLKHSGVRFHLKHLALQFLGRIDAPLDAEVDLALSYLGQEAWAEHILELVIAESPGWFDALLSKGVIGEWLDSGSDPLVTRALWLCRRHASARGDGVASILEACESRGGDWPQWVSNVVAYADTHGSRSLFEVQLRAIDRGQMPRLSVGWKKLAKEEPGWCVEALATSLRATARELGGGDDADSLFDLNSSRGELKGLAGVDFEVIVQVAEAQPKIIWDLVVPAIAELAQAASSGPDSRGLVSDRIWGDGLYGRSGEAEKCFQSVAAAAAKLATGDPVRFKEELSGLSERAETTCQRLAGAILLEAEVPAAADIAIEWLLSDKRRLRFGDIGYENSWKQATGILRRFAGSTSSATFTKLEQELLKYNDPDEWEHARWASRAHLDGDWTWLENRVGLARFLMLSALPGDRLSGLGHSSLDQLRRKFRSPQECLIEGNGVSGGFMGSGLPGHSGKTLSDRAWLRLIDRETQRARGTLKRHGRRGGSGLRGPVSLNDVATALREAARGEPSRFGELSLRLPEDADSKIRGAIVEGLLQSSAPNKDEPWEPAGAALIEQVVGAVSSLEDRGAAMGLCRMIRERPEADWSDETIDRLIYCAGKHPDPPAGALPVHAVGEDVGEPSASSLETSSINCVRAAGARAIARLLFQDPGFLPRFREAIDSLVEDQTPVVRVAAIEICVAILNIDEPLAQDLFLRCVTATAPAVLATRDADRFLAYAIYKELDGAAILVRRMAGADNQEVSRKGVIRSVATILQGPAMRSPFETPRLSSFLRWRAWSWWKARSFLFLANARAQVADRAAMPNYYRDCPRVGRSRWVNENKALQHCGIHFSYGSDLERKATAELAADWARIEDCFEDCVSIVLRLVNDDSEEVRREAMQISRVKRLVDRESGDLLPSLVSSRAFKDDPSPLLYCIEEASSLRHIAEVVLRVCDVFAESLASQSRDYSTGVAGDAHHVTELLLRLYGETATGDEMDLRRETLDRWDKLLQQRVGRAADLLKQIDAG